MDLQRQRPNSTSYDTPSIYHEGMADFPDSEKENRLLAGEDTIPKKLTARSVGQPTRTPIVAPVLTGPNGDGKARPDVNTSRSPLQVAEDELVSALETSVNINGDTQVSHDGPKPKADEDPITVESSDDEGRNDTVVENNVTPRMSKSRRRRINKAARAAGKSDTSKDGSAIPANNKRKMTSPAGEDAPAKKLAMKKGGHQGGRPLLYSDAAKKGLTVYIRGWKAALPRDAVADIREKICERIDEIPSGNSKPTFDSIAVYHGMLRLACADAASKGWIEGVVDELTDLEGTRLRHSTDPASFGLFKLTVSISDSRNATAEKIFK